MRIGVVVPVRNDADLLPCLVATLGSFRRAGDPIVVVDDGSTDAMAEARDSPGIERVRQPHLGRGVAVARGVELVRDRVDVIVVAHADMQVPADARERIAAALDGKPGVSGGALGHRIDDPRAAFRVVEWGNRFRARRLRLPYGDQAQFFRTDLLDRIGGFPRLPRMEDLELSLRLRRAGRLVYLDCPVTIGSRHWRRGILAVTLRNWGVVARYLLSGGERG